MAAGDLRVAVVGAGRMGADHIERIVHRTAGATISAVVDVDGERARSATHVAEKARIFTELDEMLAADAADAVVLATPGFLHEEALLKLIAAGLPVLCEKPLTPDPASALRVAEAEVASGRRLIMVGFMRRFDAGYRRLKEIIDSKQLGELLMLHHQHRNASVPVTFTNEMLIDDSVVHEFDAVRFFTGEEIANVGVRVGRTQQANAQVHDPQLVTVQTSSGLLADVEIFVNAKLGYQVHTQAVFEGGVVKIGEDRSVEFTAESRSGSYIDETFHSRFAAAYDLEVQMWVDAVRAGRVLGPSTWDGYATAAACGAGIRAQREGAVAEVSLVTKPSFYRETESGRILSA